MDAKYLAEIKARCDAATKGPWEMSNEPKGSGFFGTIHGKAGVSFSGNRADNEFIAHARIDIPALLAEVERQNCELSRIRSNAADDKKMLQKDNAAKDRQIATLEKALGIAEEERTSNPKAIKKLVELRIRQAQEQEGKNGTPS